MNNNNPTPPPNQPPTPQQYYYPDDEISLIDLWQTLIRRKLALISVFVLVVIFAGIYLLMAKPVYESQAIVQIGKTYNQITEEGSIKGKVIEDMNILKQRLLTEYSEVEGYKIESVDTDPEGTKDSIRIVVHAGSPDTAEESLETIIRNLKQKHDARYREKIDRLKQREMSLLSDIRGYRRQLEELDLLIKSMQGNDAGHLALQMVNRGNMRDTVVNLEKELAEIQSKLDESFETHIVGDLITKDDPVKPKPKLVIALSIVLGLMLGIFAAFFAEFIARARTTATGKEM